MTLSRRSLLAGLSLVVGGGAVLAAGASSVGCDGIEDAKEKDRQAALRDTVAVVLLPMFADVRAASDALSAAAAALVASPSVDAAVLAQKAHTTLRAAWERTTVVSIGPSDDLSLTGGAIDAWPADHPALDALLAGTAGLDAAAFSTRPANQRGFPALEHLLFDSGASPTEATARLVSDAGASRRRAAVAGAATDLGARLAAVADAWSGAKGFGREIAEAGAGSATFPAQKEGVDKLVTAMLALAELMLVAKLTKPLGLDTGQGPTPAYEQAPRSDFSLAALTANLEGIEAVYTCTYAGKSGVSLASHVAEVSSGADAAFRGALAAAKAKVLAVPAPFRVQLGGDTAPLVGLLEAVRAVKRGVATDVASPLGASIGFGYSDAD